MRIAVSEGIGDDCADDWIVSVRMRWRVWGLQIRFRGWLLRCIVLLVG